MKKIISSLLAASMLLTCVPGTVSANNGENAPFNVVTQFDFNDLESLPESITDSGGTNTSSIDNQTYADDVLHKGTLKLGGTSTGYPALKHTFTEIAPDTANLYAETEFDIIANMGTTGAHVTIVLGNKVKSLYLRCSNAGGLFAGDNANGTMLATTGDFKQWNRYKIVMQLTDSLGNKVNKINKIYLNGTDVTATSGDDYNFNTDTSKYSSFTVKMSKKSGDYAVWVDNLSVKTYTSADGTSPVPEKLELGEKIPALYTKLDEKSVNIEQDKCAQIKASIDALLDVYEDAKSTALEVSKAVADAVLISEEIDNSVVIPDTAAYEVISSCNFNESSQIPSVIAAGTNNSADSIFIDTVSYKNDVLRKNAVNLDGSSEKYNLISYNFGEIEADGKNVYVETEFDFNSFNLATSNANLTLRMGGADLTFYMSCVPGGKIYLGENNQGTELASVADPEEWSRYRFVMHLTDGSGNAVNKLVGIYVNGQDAMINPGSTIDFGEDASAYKSFSMQLSKKSGVYGICVDNLSVKKYSSSDGTSPVPHKSTLMNNISKINDIVLEYSEELDAEKLEEVTTALAEYIAVYNNETADTEAVSEAETLSGALAEELKSTLDVPDFETNPYTVHGFTNFDGDSKGVTLSDSMSLTETAVSEDNILKNSYLNFHNSSDTSVYPAIQFNFDKLSASKAGGAAPGMFIETSFDFNSEMTNGKNATFSFKNGKNNLAVLVLSQKALNLNTYNGTNVANFTSDDWINVRFVMQITDYEGNDVRKLVAIYADGKNIIKTPVDFSSGDGYTGMSVSLSNLKASDAADLVFGMQFDNFCVASYNTTEDNSHVNDRTYIAVKVQETLKKLDTYFAEDSRYVPTKSRISELAKVYTSSTATIAETEASLEELDTINKQLDALISMKKNNTTSYMYAPTLSVQSLSGASEVIADTTIVTSPAGSIKAEIIGVLLKKSEEIFGGEILKINRKTANISADTVADVSVDFDLSAYSEEEKTQMFIKVFAVSDLTSMNFINEQPYSFFESEETIDSSQSFIEEISASMVISATSQKAVIKVNAGTENKGKLITAAVLKVGEKFEDLEFSADMTAREISEPIEFISQEVADANGYALFEFEPSSEGEYNYIVRCQGKTPYKGTIGCYSVSTINNAFDEVYANKTEACLEQHLNELYINKSSFNSYKVSLDCGEILAYVLGTASYDAYSVDEFSEKMNSYLSFIGSLNKAVSADAVGTVMTTYNHLSAYGVQYNALTPTQKYNANCYILDNRALITGKSAADTVISNAITSAKRVPQNGNGGGSSSGGGSSGGGGGAGVGGFASVGSNSETVAPVEKNSSSFTDLDRVAWAKTAISMLATMNCINGKAEGIFAPNDAVTREEFVKIAVSAFGYYNPEATCEFSDVSPQSWCEPYIASAVEAGIINGIDESNFGVGQLITREDMAVIIHRILENKGKGITEDGVYIEFNDEIKFADYARDAIIDLAKSNIVNGVGSNQFMPKSNATRAEAAKMLYEAYTRI